MPPYIYKYLLPEEEKMDFSQLCWHKWANFYIQGGVIPKGALVEPCLYSIPQLVVTGDITALILLDSIEVSETELYRIAIESGVEDLHLEKLRKKYGILPLQEFPSDLRMDKFLGVNNELSAVRFVEEIEDGKGGVLGEAMVDSALLISNQNGRMLLFPSPAVPLDMYITTNDSKIVDVLSQAVKILPMKTNN